MDSTKVIRWVVTEAEATMSPTWEPKGDSEGLPPNREENESWGGPWEPMNGAVEPDGLIYFWRRPVVASEETIEARMARAESKADQLEEEAQRYEKQGQKRDASDFRIQAMGIRDTLKILRGAS